MIAPPRLKAPYWKAFRIDLDTGAYDEVSDPAGDLSPVDVNDDGLVAVRREHPHILPDPRETRCANEDAPERVAADAFAVVAPYLVGLLIPGLALFAAGGKPRPWFETAATLLALLGIAAPPPMTGHCLIEAT